MHMDSIYFSLSFSFLGRPISPSPCSFSFSLHGPAFRGPAGPALSLPFLPLRNPASPVFFFFPAHLRVGLSGLAALAPGPRSLPSFLLFLALTGGARLSRPSFSPASDPDSNSSPAHPRTVPAALRLGPACPGAAAAPI
jgi:hypothetical protein